MQMNAYIKPRQIPKEPKCVYQGSQLSHCTQKKQKNSLTKHHAMVVNLNNFRISGAKAHRTRNQSKRKSWKNYVSNLNMHASIKKKVWNTIRKK